MSTLIRSVLAKSQAGEYVVLVSSGKFSPVHRCHIEPFYEAAKQLQRQNKIVIGAICLPSADSFERINEAIETCQNHMLAVNSIKLHDRYECFHIS
jgi:nicotinic acid mononucleotide adenylyltransferase